MYFQCDFRKLGGDDFVRMWIDRRNRILHISSIKTNYSRMRIKWSLLFDSDAEEKECKVMSDEDFRKRLDESIVKKIVESLPSKQRQKIDLK